MGQVFNEISERHRDFMGRQHFFLVATAPNTGGHVNVSPKGLDGLHVLSPTRVLYLDLTGSGNETAAHLLDNGRITLMFMSFDTAPLVLRLYGHGRAHLRDSSGWAELISHFQDRVGARQIVDVEIDRVSTACGLGVPRYKFESERSELSRWYDELGSDGVRAYQAETNRQSIDGLPTGL